MIKAFILATSMLVAAPVFAQDGSATQVAPGRQEIPQSTMQPAPAEPAQAVPAATAEATPAAQPAATQDQVAQAVGRDWATYDKDANGQLTAAEFAAWINTLRQASDPAFKAGTAEATTYATQAFAAADANKSATVDKTELTTFLTPKAS